MTAAEKRPGEEVPQPASDAVDNRLYYDAFSENYDRGRERGYHKLIDDQAAAIVEPFGRGKRVLEVGCGTGLVLQRVAAFAQEAIGVDLSPGMLEHARRRGLNVQEANCYELPFADASFDVAYSYKVLAHVPDIERAMRELSRVVKPGGHVIVDVYNRHSLRYLTKKWFGPRATSQRFDEAAITTRFESPEQALARLPSSLRLVQEAGIRIVTAHTVMHKIPLVSQLTSALEWGLMRSFAQRYAGFWVMVLERRE
jgi:ubiquinone/menaquinone biosynthesis C-methylase UbiE